MDRIFKKHGTALLIVGLKIERIGLSALIQSLEILVHLLDTLPKRIDEVFLQHILRHLADYTSAPFSSFSPTLRVIRLRVGRSTTHIVLMQFGEQRGHVQNCVLAVLLRPLLQPVFPEEVEQAGVHGVRLTEEKHVVQHGGQHVDDRLEILSILIAKIDGRSHVMNGKKRHFAADLHTIESMIKKRPLGGKATRR